MERGGGPLGCLTLGTPVIWENRVGGPSWVDGTTVWFEKFRFSSSASKEFARGRASGAGGKLP